uniref:NADH-ubiquinone oxidoreductase chain 4 n=1 Tax=Nippostrongylus brasiliensis TaxID=27835 RepID=A0A1E1GIS6_NIPBR|nr:NADH dehydrogenase subunit 4 [Nippostrongylus brasiliensis]APU89584.1 NADH dehydrogenase subunit 4 [Nippostrongylus brasiliensis]BAV82766.1 NADH dehydrogenase subunit 4 [Nippostrongylus brasiliensis]
MFLSLLFFYLPTYFVFFLLLFSLVLFNNLSWAGLFLVVDSYIFVLLIFMMIFIYGMVLISELNFNLILLSGLLILICLFFFVSSNMLMLYMFFELSMFPILIMILGFGAQVEKIGSGYYLLFYASICSFPFLFIYYKSNFMFSFNYYDFLLSWEMFFILSLSFMMKFPVYFLHLWLPKAHVEAPTTASMLLAGLLLKLGTAGFMRVTGSFNFIYNNFWIYISLVGMILAAVTCTFQSDSKSLAAYSSVTHMSFLLLSLSLMLMSSKVGGLMTMLAHGYTSTLMFYFIGEFYHSSSSRMIYFMNSFFSSSMLFGIIFSLVFLSNSGVPPSLAFLAEFMIIINSFMYSKLLMFFIFLYFMIAFYYSLFLIINSLMGKMLVNFNKWGGGFSMALVLMMYNVFWLSMFY